MEALRQVAAGSWMGAAVGLVASCLVRKWAPRRGWRPLLDAIDDGFCDYKMMGVQLVSFYISCVAVMASSLSRLYSSAAPGTHLSLPAPYLKAFLLYTSWIPLCAALIAAGGQPHHAHFAIPRMSRLPSRPSFSGRMLQTGNALQRCSWVSKGCAVSWVSWGNTLTIFGSRGAARLSQSCGLLKGTR